MRFPTTTRHLILPSLAAVGLLLMPREAPAATQEYARATVQTKSTATLSPQPEARGKEALKRSEYSQALEAFRRAERVAHRAKDSKALSRALSYQALTLQQMASKRSGTPSDDRKHHAQLQRVAKLYKSALKADPSSAGAHNNLAKVYEEMGRADEALRLYQGAVALAEKSQDRHLPLYRHNYGALLDQQGRWQDATQAYTRLVLENPQSSAPHRAMLSRYLEGERERPEDLVGYLWDLLQAGQVVRAGDSALDVLERAAKDPAVWTPRIQEELMAVLAASLGRQGLPRAKFQGSTVERRISTLAKIDAFHQPLSQLLRLYGQTPGRGPNDAPLDPKAFSWWAHRQNSANDPERGVWPGDAFKALLRALSRRELQQGEIAGAESYLHLAATLGDEADPKAIEELAKIYIRQGDRQGLEELASEYQPALFRGKTAAYSRSKAAKIYDYHVTLGRIYAHLDQWGDEHTATSAIFQLERARVWSEQIEAEPGERFSPDLVNLLADGYSRTGRSQESFRLRTKVAESYVARGRTQDATKVLKPLREAAPPAEIKAEDQRRYERLLLALPDAETLERLQEEKGTAGRAVGR